MSWIIALIVGVAFAIAAKDEAMFLVGAAIGWLVYRVLALQGRLELLEKSHERLRERESSAPLPKPRPDVVPVAQRPAAPEPATQPRTTPTPASRREPVRATGPAQAATPTPRAVAATQAPAGVANTDEPRASITITSGTSAGWRSNVVLRWLLTGNVPVKVGVLVSFFGVAFLFKHAVDQGWVSFPVQVRLLIVAAFGVGLLVLGWRLRESHRVYALSIQGGGIGILYLVSFAALRLFHLLPAGAVFFVMAGLAVLAGWLAVSQSARQLAVLGSVGGFLAPILASTGSGSHVALFSYYLVLNAGIAGVAFYRHWRMLNLLGFVFTFGIGLVWGAEYYDERYFNSVEPFLLAFFLLYTAIAVLSALKQPFRLQGYVDSALVFGLPLVAFPLQAALLDGETRPLAWSASALALFYVGLSRWLSAGWPDVLRLLSQVYLALGVIFATLAVPLWLDGTWVSNTWALEAAAMIFIGVKQRRALTHWSGVALFVLAAGVYVIGLREYGATPFLLNERFLGAFMLCVALSFVAWVYTLPQEHTKEVPLDWFAAAGAWSGWLLLGTVELFDYVDNDWRAASGLLYAAVLTVALERSAYRFVPRARVLATSFTLLLGAYAFWWFVDEPHPLAVHGGLAWPVALAAFAWIVHALDDHRRWMLAAGCWLLATWFAVETNWVTDQVVESGRDWDSAAVVSVVLLLAVALRRWLARIYPGEFEPLYSTGPVFGALLMYVLLWNLVSPGLFEPVPYLPVLNPVLLLGIAVVVTLLKVTGYLFARREQFAIAAGFLLFFVTAEIARGTHHFAGIAFNPHSLWHSGIFQAALSIAWSVLGIAGMVSGAKRLHRVVWFAGAGLMGVVVVKLFLVDLGNTGSVTRIVSFIGVGLLLLVVGYLAPAPNASPAPVRQQG